MPITTALSPASTRSITMTEASATRSEPSISKDMRACFVMRLCGGGDAGPEGTGPCEFFDRLYEPPPPARRSAPDSSSNRVKIWGRQRQYARVGEVAQTGPQRWLAGYHG